MKIIKNYSEISFINHEDIITQRFQHSVYDIPDSVVKYVNSKLIPGITTILFSGSWRFNISAVYIEAKIFQNNKCKITNPTYFVEPENSKLFDKIMYRMRPTNILFLHSAFFCNYQSLDLIIERMNKYWLYQPQQIILSIPQNKVIFNRLKFSCQDIAEQYQAQFIEDCFVLQKNKS